MKKSELAHEYEQRLIDRTAAQLMKLRCSKERKLLSEQLTLTAEILRDSAAGRDTRPSPEMSRRITSVLLTRDIDVSSVNAYYNHANRLIAELYFTGGSIPASTSRICDLVSDELGLELREATTAATADDYRVSLYRQSTVLRSTRRQSARTAPRSAATARCSSPTARESPMRRSLTAWEQAKAPPLIPTWSSDFSVVSSAEAWSAERL